MYLTSTECTVELVARRFLYAPEITTPAVWRYLRDREPDMVLVDIGTNDLHSATMSPSDIAYHLIDWAERVVRQSGVKCVVFCQILHRTLTGQYRAVTSDFNHYVDEYNDLMAELCDRATARLGSGCCIRWWSHPNIRIDPLREHLIADGVHLTDLGQYRYFHSLRRAIWWWVKQTLRRQNPAQVPVPQPMPTRRRRRRGRCGGRPSYTQGTM